MGDESSTAALSNTSNGGFPHILSPTVVEPRSPTPSSNHAPHVTSSSAGPTEVPSAPLIDLSDGPSESTMINKQDTTTPTREDPQHSASFVEQPGSSGGQAGPSEGSEPEEFAPRTRLFAESKPSTSDDMPMPRQRSNAADYSHNPRSPRASVDGRGSRDVPSPLPLDHCKSASADDVKLVVEDNDTVITPTVLKKDFSPEASSELSSEFGAEAGVPGDDGGGSGGSIGSEPEPGAALDPVVRTSSGKYLQLVTPGDAVSDDEGARSEAPTEDEPEEEDEDEIKEYPSEWYTDQKHVFIFSEAGKPIYSRYGKEENIVGLYGVMQALLSCVQDNEDDLNCIRTSDRLFVFRCHPPLVMVAVTNLAESEDQVARQLLYVHKQAVFFLTQSHMLRLFKNRQSYDLRRQLTGLPKFFNGIIEFVEQEDSFLLDSIRCLPMPQSLRNEITSTLLTNKCPELVFAIVMYKRQIISIVRPKQYAVTPADLHLLMNYVQTGSTRGHGEKWAPCCLPDFNDGGYLYIHDSYLSDTVDVSLVLITNEREQHMTIIECKQRIMDQLVEQRTMEKLESVLASPFTCSDTKIPHLLHFIYKSKSSQQLVSPDLTVPYNSEDDRKQLHAKYCLVHDKLHHSDQKISIYYDKDARESVVGYLMSNSEIYCTFSPFVSRPVALNYIDKLLKWIRREENRFFILGSGVY